MSSTADYFVNPDPLGEGTYGHVVHAKHKATNRDVAIKVIDKATLRKRRYILRERQWLHKFRDSPWVVTLLASFHDSECAYLVLDISSGGDLGQLLAQAHAAEIKGASRSAWHASIPHYGKQLTEALTFLHEEARMVHADLKPANILCSAEGLLQLADFDSAWPMDDESGSGSDERPLVGTAAYASPELLRGTHDSASSTSVDLWSLGCILYAFWHGEPPFQNGTDGSSHSVMQAILAFDGALTLDLPSDDWSELVSGLLLLDPSERWGLVNVRNSVVFATESVRSPPPFLPAVPAWRTAGDSIEWKDGACGWQSFL